MVLKTIIKAVTDLLTYIQLSLDRTGVSHISAYHTRDRSFRQLELGNNLKNKDFFKHD